MVGIPGPAWSTATLVMIRVEANGRSGIGYTCPDISVTALIAGEGRGYP
jgi:hypothetical protein